MRARETSPNGLTVQAIAGTHVVQLGFDLKPEQRKGLLGFAVYRKNLTPQGTERVEGWLGGALTFPEADPPSNPLYVDLDYKDKSTNRFPIQKFRWGDYTARPDHKYLYRVQAMYLKDQKKPGEVDALEARDEVAVTIRTEDPSDVGQNNGRHQVHFNRSAASSQAFVREFPNVKPNVQEDQLPPEAREWLSRGLEQALIDFIGKAVDKNNSLHLCVYEFQKDSFLEALAQAANRGVELEIIYDSIQTFVRRGPAPGAAEEDGEDPPPQNNAPHAPTPEFLAAQAKYPHLVIDPEDNLPKESGPRKENDKAIEKHGLRKYCHKRQGINAISHNKFVVLCEQGVPVAVWTGSTNFTDGAVYGQLNVGHAIWDAALAQQYYHLHQKLLLDRNLPVSKDICKQLSPVPPEKAIQEGQPGMYPCFSPRSPQGKTQIAIDTCVRLLRGAKEMVCLTAPFPLHPDLRNALDNPDDRFIKFALLNHDSNVAIAGDKVTGQTGEVTRQEHMPAHLHYAAAGALNLTAKKAKQEKVTGPARSQPSALDSVQERMLLDVKTEGKTEDQIKAEIEALKQQGFASENLHHQGAYIHTKILLVDPFSDHPVVVTGSANFSTNSCESNDENQLYLFGERAVADVYVTEFMRMYDHYEMRDRINRGEADNSVGFLHTDDSWTAKFFDEEGGTGEEAVDRQVFSGDTMVSAL